MRLTAQQQATVRATVAEIFGPDAQVRSEIALLTTLQTRMGEQKIDLLLDYPSRKVFPPI